MAVGSAAFHHQQYSDVPAAQRRAPLRQLHEVVGILRDALMFPPTYGGLPLRLDQPRQGTARDPACSRLSVAGSIAARRPTRADTITGCAPAFHRRAPLRQHRQRHPVPAGAGGAPAVRRRAPLRPGRVGQLRRWDQLLPPLDGGLYCGDPDNLAGPYVLGGAPAVQRRAPLRPVGSSHSSAMSCVLSPLNGGPLPRSP
jgi:hypothetical protein